MIRFACPRCRAYQSAEDRHAGLKKSCTNCGQRLLIPAPPSSPSLDQTMAGELINLASMANTQDAEARERTRYYCIHEGRQLGPLSSKELRRLASTGGIVPSDIVFREGHNERVAASAVKGLFPELGRPVLRAAATGVEVQARATGFCSGCGRIYPAGIRFCSDCGGPVTATGERSRNNGRIDVIANRKMLAQLRDDADDGELFMPEMIRVALRLNPVNVQIHNFLGFINQITETTPRHDITQLVQSAMQSVDLSNAVTMLDDSLDQITGFAPEVVRDVATDILSVWPEARRLVRHRWLDDPAKEGELIRQQLRRAVRSHQQDLVIIQNHFRQLHEFYPRYQAIMNRSEVWDYILVFAAGFFGGVVGGIGAQVWDDWRTKSDTEFFQAFGNAIDQFSAATLAFTQKTEQAIEPVLAGLVRDLHDFTSGTNAALEGIIESTDISAIYHKIHDVDPADRPDDDMKQFLEIVLSNLRDQRISARSEANIRAVYGMG